MSRPTQSALLARRLGFVEIGLFAHRSYLERFGVPHRPADLATHRDSKSTRRIRLLFDHLAGALTDSLG